MLSILGLLGSGFSFLTGIAPAIAGYFTAKADVSGQEFQSAAAADQAVQTASFPAKVAIASTMAGQFLLLLFGVPAGIHWGWTILTATFPQWGFHTDPLSVTYAAAEHDIAMSFFIVTPINTALMVWSHAKG